MIINNAIYLQRGRILRYACAVEEAPDKLTPYKTKCRGTRSPQSELGYIAPDSLCVFGKKK